MYRVISDPGVTLKVILAIAGRSDSSIREGTVIMRLPTNSMSYVRY